MKKVAVIGHFAFGKEYLDGQTVKTKVLTDVLCDRFGTDDVVKLDTHGWSKNPLGFFRKVLKTAKQAEHVIILPAHNGLKVFVPILSAAAQKYEFKLHYAVVGGWLPKVLAQKPGLVKKLKQFTGIYVETGTMKNALEKMGFSNVELMLNCKDLQILQPEQMPEARKPYKLCTFSRVQQEKGMEDAIHVIRAINEARGQTAYTLDIYGPVDPAQTQWFEELKQSFPEYVSYKGSVPFDQSVGVLKEYFALLFPTRYFTEGVPGTIIDAYAAGVPVISAKWESFADVVDDGKTGYGYEFGNNEAFRDILERIAQNPEMITSLKENCLTKARDFTPDQALDVLIRQMEVT